MLHSYVCMYLPTEKDTSRNGQDPPRPLKSQRAPDATNSMLNTILKPTAAIDGKLTHVTSKLAAVVQNAASYSALSPDQLGYTYKRDAKVCMIWLHQGSRQVGSQ